MNLNRKQKIGAIVVLLATILLGAAYAALLSVHQISTDMTVKPAFSMGVFDIDGVTELNYINLGQFQWETIKYFPGGMETAPTEYYFVNNTDQVSFYVSFNITDLPTGNLGLGLWIRRGDQANFMSIGMNSIYQFAIESPVVNSNPLTHYAEWYFSINVASAEFGDYTPTVMVSAFDTPSG